MNLVAWQEYDFLEVFERLRLKKYQLPKRDYSNSGKYPIVDQGKSKAVAYVDSDDPISEELPFIVFGDHTREIKWIDYPCFLGADGTQPLTTQECCLIKYGFYLLENTPLGSLGYSRHFSLLKEKQFALPPLPEQQKIAEILGACDEAIEAQERLIAQKQQRKKGLMQKLLTGEMRFPEFKEISWKAQMLSDQIEETPRKVKKPNSAFKAVGVRCHARGMFAKPDMLPDEIALTELFEIKEGDVVVNISFAWEHAIAVAGRAHDGALVSHRFPTFVCRTNVATPSFFKYFVQLSRMRYDLKCVSPGGAGRNRVLNKKDFKKLTYYFPGIEEQARIGDFLDACSEEITQQQRQLEQLKQQKKGLMQQLLTGNVRVKV